MTAVQEALDEAVEEDEIKYLRLRNIAGPSSGPGARSTAHGSAGLPGVIRCHRDRRDDT